MSLVTLRVGTWSTTFDGTESYYNSLFSPLIEAGLPLPDELVRDDWTWLPAQWEIWMLLKDRLDSGEPAVYQSPVIYYSEIETLHRALLDLPVGWQSYVVFSVERRVIDGVPTLPQTTWNNLIESGKGGSPLPPSNVLNEPIVVVYQFVEHLYKYVEVHDELLACTSEEELRSICLKYRDEFIVEKMEAEDKGSIPLEEEVVSKVQGIVQNVRMKNEKPEWHDEDWQVLLDLFLIVNISHKRLEGDPPSYWDSPSCLVLKHEVLNSMLVLRGAFSPEYEESSRMPCTLISSGLTANVRENTHPLLYERALQSYTVRDGLYEYGMLGAQQYLETWPSSVNCTIFNDTERLTRTRLGYIVNPERLVELQAIVLLHLIGKEHALTVASAIEIEKDSYSPTRQEILSVIAETIRSYSEKSNVPDKMVSSFNDQKIGAILDTHIFNSTWRI